MSYRFQPAALNLLEDSSNKSRNFAMRSVGHGVKFVRRLGSFAARNTLGTITRVSTREPVIALTFDDGPHPEFTPRLLALLDSYQARATFFLLGKSAQRYPEIVKQIAAAGHAIGNHSWDHPSFPLLTGHERRWQIRTCGKAIVPYGEKLFRPPYGHQSLASRLDALILGYRVVAWDVVGYDWLDHTPKFILRQILDQLKPGSIVVLHDALYTFEKKRYAPRHATLAAVRMLLETLGSSYEFVTVPVLLDRGRAQRQVWRQVGDPNWLSRLKSMDQRGMD